MANVTSDELYQKFIEKFTNKNTIVDVDEEEDDLKPIVHKDEKQTFNDNNIIEELKGDFYHYKKTIKNPSPDSNKGSPDVKSIAKSMAEAIIEILNTKQVGINEIQTTKAEVVKELEG